jgi:sn-glycerol 3-phosphate transport system permease protein
MRTLPVGLAMLSQGAHSIDWGHLMAGAVISALPVVAAFLVFQRRIIGGLTAGISK